MTDVQNTILTVLEQLLERSDRSGVEVTLDVPIHGDDGLGLDSLETAELSAILEDEFGSDPFADGLMPETVGEIVAYYTAGDASDVVASV